MGGKALKYEEYDGKKYNRLTIVRRAPYIEGSRMLIAHCVCDCGNSLDIPLCKVIRGSVKSCGCLKHDSAVIIGTSKLEDLTGKKFGRLTVLRRHIPITDKTIWDCECECGNTTIAESYTLKSGKKKSCGCISREKASILKLIDLTGNRYGKWLVISRSGLDSSGKNSTWVCKCDCGTIKVIAGNSLRSGDSMSCGCENSHGEILMADALKNAGIEFEIQKKFSGCVYSNPLKFDFYIKKLNTVIEIQGLQHYEPVKYFGGEKHFEISQIRDNIKREYCKTNNIIMIEVRYDELNLIENIVGDLENKYYKKAVI